MLRALLIIASVSCISLPTLAVPTTTSTGLTTEIATNFNDSTNFNTDEGAVDEMTTLLEDETISRTTESTMSTDATTIDLLGEETDAGGVWKTIRTKFILTDKSTSDAGEPLRNEIESAINAIFKDRFTAYNRSKVVGFSPGSLVATVELDFTERVTEETKAEVVKVLYEIVERNHTLGGLKVEQLYVADREGNYDRIDAACSITKCRARMRCASKGNDCMSVCSNNTQYCLNDGTCVAAEEGSTFITCRCEEGFSGYRCQDDGSDGDDGNGKPDLYVGIIAASAIAAIIVCAIIVATCINIFNKRRIRTGRSEELFGIENVVAMELNDEKRQIEGIATQTDESFLLARSHKDGIPPRQGHAHKIMQTNESFLLVKAQMLRGYGSASRSKGAGSPVGVVSGNARLIKESSSSRPTENDSTPSTSTAGNGGHGVARKASAKKDRAPPPPQSPTPASELYDNDLPDAGSKLDGAPEAESDQTSQVVTPNKLALPAEPVLEDARVLAAADGKASVEIDTSKQSAHPLYPGRKILKV